MPKNLREEQSPLDPSPPGGAEAQLSQGQPGLKLDTRPDSLSRSGSFLADFVPIVPEHELIRRIGAGSYGEVWLARNLVGTYRAVKVVYRKTFEHDRPYDREFGGMHKYLNDPYPSGSNPYMNQIEANMTRLKRSLAERATVGAQG